jgi:hypothetical protein
LRKPCVFLLDARRLGEKHAAPSLPSARCANASSAGPQFVRRGAALNLHHRSSVIEGHERTRIAVARHHWSRHGGP